MRDKLRLLIDRMMTPIGELILLSDESGSLRAADWADYEPRMRLLLARQYRGTDIAMEPGRDRFGLASAFESYFGGGLESLRSLPVSTGGTVFQRSVWQALRSIQAGETTSYGGLAKRLGRPSAARAVGLANGANPVGIVVPCHRVVGADGSLTGYGGGLERKRWLLDHEQKHSRK
jgi:methylated-DNA-[protein]-cysteine S-methyltransferase